MTTHYESAEEVIKTSKPLLRWFKYNIANKMKLSPDKCHLILSLSGKVKKIEECWKMLSSKIREMNIRSIF